MLDLGGLAHGCWATLLRSKRQSHLKFQAAVVCVLGKDRVPGAGRLIRLTENRRGDIPNDRPGIVVIRQVSDLHRDRQAETASP